MSSRWEKLRQGGAQAGLGFTLPSSGWPLSGMASSSALFNDLLPTHTIVSTRVLLWRSCIGLGFQSASDSVKFGPRAVAVACFSAMQRWRICTPPVVTVLISLTRDTNRCPLRRPLLRTGALLGILLTEGLVLLVGLFSELPVQSGSLCQASSARRIARQRS